jgi:hypothetical protein
MNLGSRGLELLIVERGIIHGSVHDVIQESFFVNAKISGDHHSERSYIVTKSISVYSYSSPQYAPHRK